jgi:hypothetical protein
MSKGQEQWWQIESTLVLVLVVYSGVFFFCFYYEAQLPIIINSL